MSVNNSETKQYGTLVVFLNLIYLHIVYVTRMSKIFFYQCTGTFKVIMSMNDGETKQYSSIVLFFFFFCPVRVPF